VLAGEHEANIGCEQSEQKRQGFCSPEVVVGGELSPFLEHSIAFVELVVIRESLEVNAPAVVRDLHWQGSGQGRGGDVTDSHDSTARFRQKRAGRLPAEMTTPELNDLFAECIPKLRKVARRMFRNQQDSEDALQEALLLAFRKIDQFEGRSSFSTWVHTIVRNTSRAYYRKATAHPTVSTDAPNEGEESLAEHRAFVDERPTPERSYLQQERSEIFQNAAEQLPENQHAAVLLFYSLGLGEKATAEALGITISALKAQLHRSRILLSYRIRKNCMTDVKPDLTRARPLMRHRRARCHVSRGAIRLQAARMN